MANDTSSSHITKKGPITRSAREALPEKVVIPSSIPNRKSELLEKRTPPTLAVRSKSWNHKKMEMTTGPLRRSERTRNLSFSPPANPSPSTSESLGLQKRMTVKQLTFEAKDASEFTAGLEGCQLP